MGAATFRFYAELNDFLPVGDRQRDLVRNFLGRPLGFDAVWRRDATDEELVSLSLREGRILLTRDRGLLKRRELTHAAAVRGTDPREQLPEVVWRFDLARSATPFTRCLTCNGRLAAVPKEEVLDRLPPETRLHYDALRACLSCRRVFWWGPHSRRVREIIEEALRFGGSGG